MDGFEIAASPQEMLDYSKELEKKHDYKLNVSGASDNGSRGITAANHAEKQVAIAHMKRNINKPIGVSREMCGDCRNFFRAHAQDTRENIIVADPKYTRIFRSDGRVEIYDINNKLLDVVNEPPTASYTIYEGKAW